MISEIHKKMREKMKQTIEACRREFAAIRTGKASISLLDGVKVECYNTFMPLNQLSTLATPESNLIIIQPWDKTIIKDIEKAILKSGLGLTAIDDGNVIRINIPQLSEERREELVKVAKRKAEELRVSLRNTRREGIEELRKMEKEKEISEDERRKAEEEAQKAIDEFIKKIDEMLQEKEKEIMEV